MAKIQASLILEILGRPAEHIKEALNTVVVRMGSEKGVKIVNKTYHEPLPVEDAKDLFTTFVEVDVELDSLMDYIGIIFNYMPANIEITHPENISIGNIEMNELGNSLVRRLHHYDAVTKNTVAERNLLLQRLKEVAPHLFKKRTPQPEAEKKPAKKAKNKAKKKSR